MLLEFAAQAATISTCMRTLIIDLTASSAEDGDKFLLALADGTIDSLHHLRISHESAWFKNRDGSIVPLLVLLARQASLKGLEMKWNCMSEA